MEKKKEKYFSFYAFGKNNYKEEEKTLGKGK